MAATNLTGQRTVRTEHGDLRISVYDRVPVDRLYAMMLHTDIVSRFMGKTNQAGLQPDSLRRHVVFLE